MENVRDDNDSKDGSGSSSVAGSLNDDNEQKNLSETETELPVEPKPTSPKRPLTPHQRKLRSQTKKDTK